MVDYDFSETVAFVTGAGRGQGRSHAMAFAENGADVIATDVCETTGASPYDLSDEDDLAETVALVEANGVDALGLPLDVTRAAAVERAIERSLSEFGQIDILANNAGIAPPSTLVKLDEETWDVTIDVNLKGMWLCAKHVGAHMIDRGGPGRIVNTSSVAGLSASPGLGHYAAAKHGIIGLTKSLAVELSPYDITVNAICPSAVDTPMTAGIVEAIDDDIARLAERSGPDNLLGEIIRPADVSAALMWLSSHDSRFVTGIALPVAAGATAI